MEPFGQFNDKDFGLFKILFRTEEKLGDVCLFASHTFSPSLPEYIYYYLDDIKRAGLSLIFISTSTISKNDLERLSGIAVMVVERENRGTDFGSWCTILRYLDYGKSFTSLYLCNDSVFGPLISFTEIHNKFLSVSEDILGITDSHQGAGYHIQSYFVGLKPIVLKATEWESFWRDLALYNERTKVIEFYEIGLSQFLIGRFKCFIWTDWSKKIDNRNILYKVSQSEILRPRWLNRVLYDPQKIIFTINPSSFLWQELVAICYSPVIKKELFIYPHLVEECEMEGSWEKVLKEHTSYPTGLIKYFLVDYFLHRTLQVQLSEFGKIQFFISDKKNTRQTVVADIYQSKDVFVFDLIESLAEISERNVSIDQELYNQLSDLEIRHLQLTISATDRLPVNTVFVYLTHHIAELNIESRDKIKAILKKITNPVIIVPDTGSAAIICSILSLIQEGLVLENELVTVFPDKKIIEIFKKLLSLRVEGRLRLFQRPVISEVVTDALNNTNYSGLLNIGSKASTIDSGDNFFNRELYKSKEEYRQYLMIRSKYDIIYEKTPLWYKKIGQVIKLLKGNKRLILNLRDKGKKELYRATVEDITHWYYLQYEVLPQWYKKIGHKIIKRKSHK